MYYVEKLSEQYFRVNSNPDLPLLIDGNSQVLIGLGKSKEPGLDGISISDQPIFGHLRQYEEVHKPGATNEEAQDFRGLFLASTSLVESRAIVTEALIKKLSKSFPTLETIFDARKPLHSYGVDSLLALELRNWLAREFSANIPIFEILGGSTFLSVGLIVSERSEVKHNIRTLEPDE